MKTAHMFLAAVLVAAAPGLANAQGPGDRVEQAPGFSLARSWSFAVTPASHEVMHLERQLTLAVDRRSALNLQYFVGVVAQTPRVQVLSGADDLLHAPVPNSLPTHRDLRDVTTPKPFRAPPADFTALIRR